MKLVLLTALGIGGATVFGAIIGFLIPDLSQKAKDIMMAFAAGVMLAAAIMGLLLPAAQLTGKKGIWIIGLGMLSGALLLNLMDKITPHLHHISGIDKEEHNKDKKNVGDNDKVFFIEAKADDVSRTFNPNVIIV